MSTQQKTTSRLPFGAESNQMTLDVLAERLSALMEEYGLNPETLGKKIGASKSAVRSWTKGLNEPVASNVAALAQFFVVSADYLLGLENMKAEAEAERSRKAAELDEKVTQLIDEVREFKSAGGLGDSATFSPDLAEPKK